MVSIEIDDQEPVTGVSGTGAVGTVTFFKWTQIDDAQNPNWTEILEAA